VKLFAFFLCLPLKASAQVHTVCAIGDSQVEPGSMLVENLQRELGPEYVVTAHGRRSWTTQQWIASGDFGTVCGPSEIVLISLGGNDRSHGISWEVIERHLETLIRQLPRRTRIIYHMTVPRYYRPLLSLTPDGIHLTPSGARTYAHIIAPHLRVE